MRRTQSLSITLPAEMADRLQSMVASGEFASESEVVQEGLAALFNENHSFQNNAELENWLKEEVVPTLQAIDSGLVETRGLEETRSRLHARLDRMIASGK